MQHPSERILWHGWHAIGALLLVLAPLASPGARAQEPVPERSALERWEKKSAPEQELLRERFLRLQGLPEEERELFVERGRRLAEMRRRFRAEDGVQSFEEELHLRARTQIPRLRERLPHPLLEALQRAAAVRRPALLERHLRSLRSEQSPRWLERLGGRLELDADALRELRELPELERLRFLLELHRSLFERSGEPEPLRQERWRDLPDAAPSEGLPARRRALERLRERLKERAAPRASESHDL